MSELEKINAVIEDMEEQVRNINEFTNVLERITKLSGRVEELSNSLTHHSERFLTVSDKLESGLETIQAYSTKLNEETEARIIQQNGMLQDKILQANNEISTEMQNVKDVLTNESGKLTLHIDQSFSDQLNKTNKKIVETKNQILDLAKIISGDLEHIKSKTHDSELNIINQVQSLIESHETTRKSQSSYNIVIVVVLLFILAVVVFNLVQS